MLARKCEYTTDASPRGASDGSLRHELALLRQFGALLWLLANLRSRMHATTAVCYILESLVHSGNERNVQFFPALLRHAPGLEGSWELTRRSAKGKLWCCTGLLLLLPWPKLVKESVDDTLGH